MKNSGTGYPPPPELGWPPVGPGEDEPLVWIEGSTTQQNIDNRNYLVADHQGSIVALTNGSGVATYVNTYDEYGIPSLGNFGRFQYTGQVWIPEANVYHYKARAYSPVLGRFLQTDRTGYADGMNMYAYVGGDPVNRADPTGTMGGDCCTIFGLGSNFFFGANENGPAVDANPGRSRTDADTTNSGGLVGALARSGERQATQDMRQAEKLETPEGRREHLQQGAIGLGAGIAGAVVIEATVAAGSALTVETTVHGAARVGANAGRGGTLVSRFDVLVTRFLAQQRLTQADGASVFVRTLSNGRNNVVVQNASGRVITTFQNISTKSLTRLSKNYGWR